jgi:hypothetical protein
MTIGRSWERSNRSGMIGEYIVAWLAIGTLDSQTILSRVLVTETGFGLVIGFINRFTVRNYEQLLITLPVIQFTIIFYWLQLIQRCRCFNTLWFTVTNTSRLLVSNYITGTGSTRRKSFTHTQSLQFTKNLPRLSAIENCRELLEDCTSFFYKYHCHCHHQSTPGTGLKLYYHWRDIASGRTT